MNGRMILETMVPMTSFIAALLLVQVEAFVPPVHMSSPPFCSVAGETSRRIGREARREPYYEDYPDDDELYYNSRRNSNQSFRQVGDGLAERELRNIPYEDEETSNLELQGKRPQMQRHDDKTTDNTYYQEEERDDVDDEEPIIGNYWSNPNGKAISKTSPDTALRFRPERTRPRRRPPDERDSRSRKSRSTFRSGVPEPPAPISDFYNRLFWYGVDPEETTSPADKTMFGGTKGKFNGLSYINQVAKNEDSSSLSRTSKNDYWDEKYDDRYEPSTAAEGRVPTPLWRSVTPPYDPPTPRKRNREQDYSEKRTARRSRRPSTKRRVDDFDDPDTSFFDDWAARRVSNWFDGNDDEDDFIPRRKSRRTKASGFNFLDSFLGLDRRQLEKRATEYDERMGIGEKRPHRRRPSTHSPRNGQVYSPADEENYRIPLDTDFDVIDTEAVSGAESNEEDKNIRRELTWEERAAAIERVPPADVPAWGVTGDLGVDARTKAITDALEDIADARRDVEEKERNEALLREEMTVLRVDMELEKIRLRKSQMNAKMIQDRLRRIDRQIEDAARSLRYSQMKLQEARDDLSEVEMRHWAVLSFYNPKLAERGIEEALRELEETEPAVRRFVTKVGSEEATGDPVDAEISKPDAPVETAKENEGSDQT